MSSQLHTGMGIYPQIIPLPPSTRLLIPNTPASPTLKDGPSEAEGSSKAMHSRCHVQEEFTQPTEPSRPTSFRSPSAMTAHWWDVGQVTIDILPDDVLLEIFERYGEDNLYFHTWWWETLVHVCQRWRNVVFASPRRLHLLLTCNGGTPTRRSLDIWPPFPIVVTCFLWDVGNEKAIDNILAALEHRDRVSEITLDGSYSVLEGFITVMQESFPALTHLRLSPSRWGAFKLVLPETFLGGFAPSLRSCTFMGVSFPALPKLISSSSQLVSLCLRDIPYAGYISPADMTTCLAGLHNLEVLSIGFLSPSPSDRTNPPPPTRVVLPTLNYFKFEGDRKYLEDFVARIDTPLLDSLKTTVYDDPMPDIPQFHQFICRTERLQPLNRAEVLFYDSDSSIILGSPTRHGKLELSTRCSNLARQVLAISRVWNQYLLRLSKNVEHLRIKISHNAPIPKGWGAHAVDPTQQWLEFFHPFPAVQSLYLCKYLGPLVAAALQELTGNTVMQVLPALRSLHLEGLQPSGSVKDAIEPFVAMRQLADLPVVIHRWQPELECDWEADR